MLTSGNGKKTPVFSESSITQAIEDFSGKAKKGQEYGIYYNFYSDECYLSDADSNFGLLLGYYRTGQDASEAAKDAYDEYSRKMKEYTKSAVHGEFDHRISNGTYSMLIQGQMPITFVDQDCEKYDLVYNQVINRASYYGEVDGAYLEDEL